MRIYPQYIPLTFMCLIVSIVLSGCSLLEMRSQAEVVEGTSSISGNIQIDYAASGEVYAVLLKEQGDILLWENEFLVGENGKFLFYANKGNYVVGAFIDSDGDRRFKSGEPGTYIGIDQGRPEIINVGTGNDISVGLLEISEPLTQKPARKLTFNRHKSTKNIGAVISLDSSIFSDENVSAGMWKPLDFLARTGAGLYFLDEYQQQKTPIIFIHGIMGNPRIWENIVSSIDTEIFQPWVFYYPSGVRLDMVSDYLIKATTELEQRYHYPEFYVVAHSMGGLVARSFVKKYQTTLNPAKLNLVMTINSPMGGMASARSGVERSPIVVPSWRDVATGSEFLADLKTWKWPQDIPYHLVFSYEKGEAGDGIVQIHNQIPYFLQRDAVGLYGYNAEHTGILDNEIFIADFIEIIENASN